ncbi:MAG: tocopherol cyclase family protein [Candidatus Izimaplasma sp.]|nr:tocopherol cyclase family protein [Candidatus Izimaplasma bacterium]
MFRKIRNPIKFQGKLNKLKYFEGWYYKVVSSDQNYTLAIIPGISLNEVDSHAFVQVFLTKTTDNSPILDTAYLRFDKNQFVFKNNPFHLQIENNHFTKNHLSLSINSEEMNIYGKLYFENQLSLKKSIFSPSIMGIFAYIPNMECYHGVVSMNHRIMGSLKIDDKIIDFSQGKGYIEKDWGKSFPEKYVWMQSNHFKNKHTSFMFSHATIPFLNFKFNGLIVNLVVNNKEYRFATYNFAKVKTYIIDKNSVDYRITKGNLTLYVKAFSEISKSLAAPKDGLMNQSIKEGLSGTIFIELYIKGKLIYRDKGVNAGLEIMM